MKRPQLTNKIPLFPFQGFPSSLGNPVYILRFCSTTLWSFYVLLQCSCHKEEVVIVISQLYAGQSHVKSNWSKFQCVCACARACMHAYLGHFHPFILVGFLVTCHHRLVLPLEAQGNSSQWCVLTGP